MSQQRGSSSLWKRTCVGMTLPLTIVAVVVVRQMGGQHLVAAVGGGAPIEVTKRASPVVAAKAVERPDVKFNASNPYGRAVEAPSSSAVANKTVATAWEIREMKAAAKAGTANRTSKVIKPKKVFDDGGGEGYMPGESVVPAGGVKISAVKHLTKLGHAKCVAIVGFYNSEDVLKSMELAAIWNEFREAEVDKFTFGLCDVRKPGGLDAAIEVGVYPNGSEPAVGLPAVLALPSKDAVNETVVVLRGTTGTRAAPKRALALAKTVSTMIDNLNIGISKDGCYTKLRSPVGDDDRLRRSTAETASTTRRKSDAAAVAFLEAEAAASVLTSATSAS